MKRLLLNLLFTFLMLSAVAQLAKDRAIQLNITTQKIPAQIKLSWPAVISTTTSYSVFKKNPDSSNWGAALVNIPSNASLEFIDNQVSIGKKYEYKVVGNDGTLPFGYALCGIEVPYDEKAQRVILLVDNTISNSLSVELQTLKEDLIGDGWQVVRHDVDRFASVPSIKAIIANDYATLSNVKAVLLIGHIPVPYSGELLPDGHSEHNGAWPADLFYGDMNGNWTDDTVNTTAPSRSANWNVPGDGKYDQSEMRDIEIQVGRIDMANLPSFALSETNLLKQYLTKDHDFRRKNFTVRRRGFIIDGFQYFGGEAFAACGWRNFSTLLSPDSIVNTGNYFDMIGNNSFLWAYGCGAGSYQSANSIGTTSNYATTPLNAVFVSNFGSYFGDWDNSNNFLRAAIANSGKVLINFWNGRPYWSLHYMALGGTIGESMISTQNNAGDQYEQSYGAQQVHVALMGDPTLYLFPLAPATNATITKGSNLNVINWTASVDTGIIGYHIYRSKSLDSFFTRLTPSPINAFSFTDNNPLTDTNFYIIRAVRLEKTASGSFYNYSNGTIIFTSGVTLPIRLFDFNAKKINEQIVQLDWTIAKDNNADKFEIEKSVDGISFKSIGTVKVNEHSFVKTNYSFRDNITTMSNQDILFYRVKEVDLNGQFVYSTIKAILWKNKKTDFVKIFPNPSNGVYKILLGVGNNISNDLQTDITVTDGAGKQIYHFGDKLPSNIIFNLDLRKMSVSKGVYMLNVSIGNYKMSERLLVF